MALFPIRRNRRLRASNSMRELVAETHISVHDLIYPLFIVEGEHIRREVASMPGVYQISLDYVTKEVAELESLGIRAVLLFGVPDKKDDIGSGAYADDGIVQRAIQKIKSVSERLLVIADTCLCEYTEHGHCGLIKDGVVDNDKSLPLLAQTALSQAKAGADIIAPSNMMDGFVASIRKTLDEAGFAHIPIMSYAVKYQSALYGPFRDAAGSSPQFGDRQSYQMDVRNRKEALREAEMDLAEGADFLIVKPGIAYLDIVSDLATHIQVPIVSYQVSGEYAMIKAASEEGWLEERVVIYESLLSMKRAGAQLIITYFAKEMAKVFQEGRDNFGK